ncbi:MAG: S41 family peptidase [Bacteroidia bacterium]|nr:S41 family peptidase [Bacteroidia bacterium]
MKFSSRIKKALVAFSLITVLLLGLAFSPDYFEISKNLDIFNAVYRELNVSYVDGTKPGQLMKTGIDAMLNSLDPYTVYYTENDIEDYRYMTTGEYGGIGATVLDMNGKIIITDPYEGFAAYKAGLRAGDQIVEVNGINVVGKKTEDISTLLKGTAGTNLTLKILKPAQKDPVAVSIVREEIKNKAVPYFGLLPNSETGYIKLVSFTENCSGEVKEALMDLKGKGCKNLVLDLRGNLGGLLNEAVNIVNFFIDKGQEVVFTKGKVQEWDHPYLSVNNPVDTQMPLVVLVDENSASASEIVCGALQDLDRAVIVGKRTFGKGLVQQTKQLIYNAQIKVTVAKYYIPSGRCVQALDYSNKDTDGRVEKVPDSLITAFKTKGGRIVYDGAGVMPDVKTKEEKYANVLMSLVSKHHIFNYATEFVLKHKDIASVKDFALSDADYNDFTVFLKDKEYNYKSREEIELEEFKKGVEEVNGFDAIKQEYETLANKLKNDKKEDLVKHKNQIKKYLEEEIAGRYYFQKGRIEYGLKHDEDIAEALKIVSDANRVKSILTTVDKPTKPFNVKKKF